jgi:hypothetical protein
MMWICSQERLVLTGAGAVGRFVSEDRQEDSDIDTVSLPHVESVVQLSK